MKFQSDDQIKQITRLAPSPTGALHLGNAFSFLSNWALSRKHQWHIHLRIEDLDTPRIKPGIIEQTIRTMEWLGLDWDSGPTTQANSIEKYVLAMQKLAHNRYVYPCELTRAQIEEAASAPHTNEHDYHETRFDPSLRPNSIPDTFDSINTNWRLIVGAEQIRYTDQLMGQQVFDLDQIIGDFVLWTKRGTPSYQLAVVIDDTEIGVTQVVRGCDLLNSAARQIMIYQRLKEGTPPTYTHLPLIRGNDGRRLAKRHGDTRIDSYIAKGVSRERILGLIAYWCGIIEEKSPISRDEFLDGFSLDTLPKEDIVFLPEDDEWLTR